MSVTVGLVLDSFLLSFLLGRTLLAILFFEFFSIARLLLFDKAFKYNGGFYLYLFWELYSFFSSMRYEHLPFIIDSLFFSFQAIVLLI